MLGISTRTLYKLTSEGSLRAARIGARVGYRIETLRQWVADQER